MGIMAKTGLVWSDRYLEHQTGPHYPERPERLSGIKPRLQRAGLFDKTVHIEPVLVDLDWVERVHTPAYIDRFRQRTEKDLPYLDTTECPLCPRTFETARWAARPSSVSTRR